MINLSLCCRRHIFNRRMSQDCILDATSPPPTLAYVSLHHPHTALTSPLHRLARAYMAFTSAYNNRVAVCLVDITSQYMVYHLSLCHQLPSILACMIWWTSHQITLRQDLVLSQTFINTTPYRIIGPSIYDCHTYIVCNLLYLGLCHQSHPITMPQIIKTPSQPFHIYAAMLHDIKQPQEQSHQSHHITSHVILDCISSRIALQSTPECHSYAVSC